MRIAAWNVCALCVPTDTNNCRITNWTEKWKNRTGGEVHWGGEGAHLTVLSKRRRPRWCPFLPPRLNIKNSMFSAHSVFIYSVWMWEQTMIVSVYSIKWLVCITETESVYFAVRTGSLNKLEVNLFSFLVRTVHIKLNERSANRTGLSPSTAVYHSTSAPYSSSTCCSYLTDKRAKPRNLPKSCALSELGDP